MSTAALINMVIVLGVVVGGFAGFLILAMRKESGKGPDD